MDSPLDILLPYQRAWVLDGSRFKIGLWARQTGKSFACAAEAVRHAMTHPGALWVILSAGERQALEFMRKAKAWARAFDFALAQENGAHTAHGSVLKNAEIVFKNASRMIALPANAATARGYSGNLILDEFASHENPDEIWRAIYPSISNPLSGGQKLLRIVSTPNGKTNKFYELFKNAPRHYARHKITLSQAVAQGLPVDIEQLRQGIADPDGWAQEYECEFSDIASVFLSHALLQSCESAEASLDWDEATLEQPGEFFLGVDIGRTHDLSVFWLVEKCADVLVTRGVRLFENTPFHVQLEFLLHCMHSPHLRRACVDSSGIGAMLAEEARRIVGTRVEPCRYTAAFKEEIFLELRHRFETRALRIPACAKLREDFHALKKSVTSAGNVRLLAPRNADGHSDRANAAALACHAVKTFCETATPHTLPRPPRRGGFLKTERALFA